MQQMSLDLSVVTRGSSLALKDTQDCSRLMVQEAFADLMFHRQEAVSWAGTSARQARGLGWEPERDCLLNLFLLGSPLGPSLISLSPDLGKRSLVPTPPSFKEYSPHHFQTMRQEPNRMLCGKILKMKERKKWEQCFGQEAPFFLRALHVTG